MFANLKCTLLKALFSIINLYTQHLSFPHRGWKYVRFLLTSLHLDNKIYLKKIQPGIYLHVNAVDHIQQHLFWYGYYEKDAIKLWQTIIQENSIVVDIGANIGYYSVIAAHKAVHGKVYAFEPSLQTYEKLCRNVEVNSMTNVETLRYAISNKNNQQSFYISGPDNTGMSGLMPAENFSGQIETVESISLDQWIIHKQITKIDIIKIDIEGAEIDALKGMQHILQQHQPVIFIEIRNPLLKQFGQTASGIYHLLFSSGYNAYEIISKLTIKKTDSYIEADTVIFAAHNYKFPPEIHII